MVLLSEKLAPKSKIQPSWNPIHRSCLNFSKHICFKLASKWFLHLEIILKFQIFFYDTDLLHNIILEKDQTKKNKIKYLQAWLGWGNLRNPTRLANNSFFKRTKWEVSCLNTDWRSYNYSDKFRSFEMSQSITLSAQIMGIIWAHWMSIPIDVNLVITWSRNPHAKTSIPGKPSKSGLIGMWHKDNLYPGTITIGNGKPPPNEYWFANERYKDDATKPVVLR